MGKYLLKFRAGSSKWATLSQSGVKYYKVGQELLQSRADSCCYKVAQELYKIGQVTYYKE